MATDFRDQLTVLDADDPTTCRYDDLLIGDWFILSIQTRPLYDTEPRVMELPPTAETYTVGIMTQGGIISYGRWGVWEEFQARPWAKLFNQEFPLLWAAENVPLAMTQQIFDDLSHFAATRKAPANKKKGQPG